MKTYVSLRKMLLCFLVCLFGVLKVHGYAKNQYVTMGGFWVKVISDDAVANDMRVYIVGLDKENKIHTGNITIPATIKDNVDKEFDVEGVGTSSTSRSECNWQQCDLTSITIEDGVKYIVGEQAFRNCGASKISIPKSVIDIPEDAFGSFSTLKTIEVDEENPYYRVIDGVLYCVKDNDKQLLRYPPMKEVANGTFEVPDNVTALCKSAFAGTTTLKTIIIPESVTSIEPIFPNNLESFNVDVNNTVYQSVDGVLLSKDGKTLIYFPGSNSVSYTVCPTVETIVTNAFYNTGVLKELNLSNVKTLENHAISNCTGLTSLTIPASVSTIENGAIYGCSKIANYTVETRNPCCKSYDGVIYSLDEEQILYFPLAKTGNLTLPPNIKVIPDEAFAGSSINGTITFNKNLEEIGVKAFNNCKVKYLDFSAVEGDIIIKGYAFNACGNLLEVDFKNLCLEKIEDYCFDNCKQLTKVTISPETKIIGRAAFSRCSSLTTVIIPNNSALEEIQDWAFYIDKSLTNFSLGKCNLNTIGFYAFQDAKLSEFVCPATVTTINGKAFAGCSLLRSFTFEENSQLTKIGGLSFQESGIESIIIPENVEIIEQEAFADCKNIVSVYIPEKTTDVSSQAFVHCDNLIEINVDPKNENYSSIDGYFLSWDKKTLLIFPPGKANDSFTLLPPSLETIGDYAFYDCANLKNVTIPNKVTHLGARAFGLCRNLNTITFLCDNIIPKENMIWANSAETFDCGTIYADLDLTHKIDINVRKELLSTYVEDEWYSTFFKSISPSFKEGTDEFIAVSDNAVDLLSSSTTDVTYVMPRTVAHNGKNYAVSLIGDYALQGISSDVKEVVVFDNVEYIGGKAFVTDPENNTSTVQSVFFIESNPTKEMLSTTRFELSNDYAPVASSTTIYVKPSALEKYKTAWTNQASQIDYKIPGVNIATKYGTFSREFDTDFTQYSKDNGGISDVRAFVGGVKDTGAGDWGDETEYHITFEPTANNGTYVPANTGVLLKVIGSEDATGAGFYYCIHEDAAYNKEPNVPTNNLIPSGSVDKEIVSDGNLYVMSKGYMTRVKAGGKARVSAHKAYLQLSPEALGKKLVMSFYDEDENIVTSLGDIDVNTPSTEVYYDLSGRRIVNPVKGIYVVNGKKVVL